MPEASQTRTCEVVEIREPPEETAVSRLRRRWRRKNEREPRRLQEGRVARFKHQTMSSYTIPFTPFCTISFYYAVALIFIPVGIAVLVASGKIVQTEHVRYDNMRGDVGSCILGEARSCTATVPVTITKKIAAPSYFYYGVRNFYQNARKYAKSRSSKQLRGISPLSERDLDACAPLKNRTEPCGITAASRFTDEFMLCRDKGCSPDLEFKTTTTGIAWQTDVRDKFRRNGDFNKMGNELVESEDFVVWMRLSAFSNFDKLYRIIEEDIEPGNLYVKITASYPVSSFNGKKIFYITTTKWFGARNRFLGCILLVVGLLSMSLASIFLVQYLCTPKQSASESLEAIKRELSRLNVDLTSTAEPSSP